MFDWRYGLVIYMMIALLVAYPFYFEQRKLVMGLRVWINTSLMGILWPLTAAVYLYFVGDEFLKSRKKA